MLSQTDNGLTPSAEHDRGRGFSWYIWPSWWLPLKLALLAFLVWAGIWTLLNEGLPQIVVAGRDLLTSGIGFVLIVFASPLVLVIVWLMLVPSWVYLWQVTLLATLWQGQWSRSSAATRLGRIGWTPAILVGFFVAGRIVSTFFAFVIGALTGTPCAAPPLFCG